MESPLVRRRRGRRIFVGAAIVCVSALAAEALLLSLPEGPNVPGTTRSPQSSVVEVADVDLIDSYATSNLSDTSYLQQADCGCAPLNVPPGQQFSWWVQFGNTDRVNHTVESIQVDSPFVLSRISPSPTVSLPPGGTATVTLVILTPSDGGVYVVTGSVTVS